MASSNQWETSKEWVLETGVFCCRGTERGQGVPRACNDSLKSLCPFCPTLFMGVRQWVSDPFGSCGPGQDARKIKSKNKEGAWAPQAPCCRAQSVLTCKKYLSPCSSCLPRAYLSQQLSLNDNQCIRGHMAMAVCIGTEPHLGNVHRQSIARGL